MVKCRDMEPETPAETPNPPTPSTPAAPPAAKIVATGQRSEREIALERERDAALTDAERMKAERDTEKTARKPAAKPAAKKKGGWTFFHEKAEGAD